MRTPLLVLVLLMCPVAASAVDTAPLGVAHTSAKAGATETTDGAALAQQRRELIEARMWGLDLTELRRARQLLAGPRGAFSVPNISPVEALGIHARTPAERDRYAELFARLTHEDVERVLAFQAAYDAAMRRLYPDLRAIELNGRELPRGFIGVPR
ncbi:hypothetical protein [Denitromonas iodatirespirans]|uniref:DUF2059 domain-containing protein n=1 Tax=Denitromonas iodatirespirans TaxID=2795389 RepID=A0A944D5K9_DENI1|nr:hypothetical protein [Denitromonas iodatirespirans]MBT0960344.1 hypothetical protein [Denitromonas iodatirespirans]